MAVSGYNIYLNGTKVNGGLVTGLSYNLTGLSAETSYNVEVRAVDGAGNESASDAAQVKNFTTSAVSTGTEEVIFRDTFVNTTGSDQILLTTTGWYLYYSNPVNNSSGGYYSSGGASQTTGTTYINADVAGKPGEFLGYTGNSDAGLLWFSGITDRLFWFTNKHTIPSARKITKIKAMARIAHTTSLVRPAVKVNGIWYLWDVSDPQAAAGVWELKEWVIDVSSTTNWKTMDFTQATGDPLTELTATGAALPAGDITAYGIYILRDAAKSGTELMDNYEITVI